MTNQRTPLEPLAPIDEYAAARGLLRHVRIMKRFFREIVDRRPGLESHYAELYAAYLTILNEELAPHALQFALAITELEDAYPEIAQPEDTP